MSNNEPLHLEGAARCAPTAGRSRVCVALLALILLFPLSCDQISQRPLTGHRHIAVALRSLLDIAYTGPDYPTYHAGFQSFAKHVQENIEVTPHEMRPHVKTIMAYLQIADEVLQWQAQQREDQGPPQLAIWTDRYPFLQAAIGARLEAPNTFDVETALQMLFEKTDQTLVAMQVKNKPI